MSNRAVYDCNPEDRDLHKYGMQIRNILRRWGVTDLDEFEVDYILGGWKRGVMPEKIALDIKRWHDLSQQNA